MTDVGARTLAAVGVICAAVLLLPRTSLTATQGFGLGWMAAAAVLEWRRRSP